MMDGGSEYFGCGYLLLGIYSVIFNVLKPVEYGLAVGVHSDWCVTWRGDNRTTEEQVLPRRCLVRLYHLEGVGDLKLMSRGLLLSDSL